MNKYSIEFDGYAYIVSDAQHTVAAFSSLDDAFAAKNEFEEKRPVSMDKKTPPAMRQLIAQSHQKLVAC